MPAPKKHAYAKQVSLQMSFEIVELLVNLGCLDLNITEAVLFKHVAGHHHYGDHVKFRELTAAYESRCFAEVCQNLKLVALSSALVRQHCPLVGMELAVYVKVCLGRLVNSVRTIDLHRTRFRFGHAHDVFASLGREVAICQHLGID